MSSGTFNRIDRKFDVSNGHRRKCLVIYTTAGYPDMKTTGELILELDRSGVDIVELGVPFSDPVADGPTIQGSSQTALKKGTGLKEILSVTRKLRKRTKCAMVLMGYYNPILQYGLDRFVSDCSRSGIDGLIVPDLIPEESSNLSALAKEHGLKLIFLLAPTSGPDRIKAVASKSSGFIYCVSVTGITGARAKLPDFRKYIGNIRKYTDKPIALGFGISTPKMVKQVLKYADAAIIGSAVIKQITANIGKPGLSTKIGSFVKSLKRGMPNG